jgi:hypothetical protein
MHGPQWPQGLIPKVDVSRFKHVAFLITQTLQVGMLNDSSRCTVVTVGADAVRIAIAAMTA